MAEVLWNVISWGVSIDDHDFGYYRRHSTIDTFSTMGELMDVMIQKKYDDELELNGEDDVISAREYFRRYLEISVDDVLGDYSYSPEEIRSYVEWFMPTCYDVKIADVVGHAIENMESQFSHVDFDEYLWEKLFNQDYDILNRMSYEDKLDRIRIDMSTGQEVIPRLQVDFFMRYTESPDVLYFFLVDEEEAMNNE
jgi:hypothetical protein